MIRHRQFGLVGAGLALVAAILVPCVAGAQEALPAHQDSTTSASKDVSGTQPEFKPGIPGLKMADVRDHKHLWHDIEELQSWEYGDRISIAEYRSKSIEKVSHFLGLGGGDAARFSATVSEAVGSIRASFRARQGGEPGEMEASFSADLGASVARVTSLLRNEARHQLFEPECKKWLLQLAFGPSEAKESKESKDPKATEQARQARTNK